MTLPNDWKKVGYGGHTPLVPPPPPKSQAERIIAKFGGARRLAIILKQADESQALNPSSIYRWTYPKEKGGTGGVVPTAALPLLIKAARLEGIFLTPEDLYPGVR